MDGEIWVHSELGDYNEKNNGKTKNTELRWLQYRILHKILPTGTRLKNGLTVWAEIWYAVRDPLARLFQKLMVKHSALAQVRTPFSYLGNGWMDRAEIWNVVRDPSAKRFTEVYVRYVRTWAARVHVRIPFLNLGNGWTGCIEIWCVARGLVAMRLRG